MNPTNYDGVGEMREGEFEDMSIDGIYTCKGDINARDVRISGIFKCVGSFEADTVECDGIAEFESGIKAKKITINGMVSVKNEGKIEADEIICEGFLSGKSEISADIINADGFINAKEIVGDSITIKSRANGLKRMFLNRYSKIELIEATTVDLTKVSARKVSGHEVNIGPKCTIETVDCDGTLSIHHTATVKEVIGECDRR